MPTDDQKLNYDLIHSHPQGKESQDDVIDAVMGALREVFNKGLNPLATKVALETLAARCREILDDEEAQSELTS